MESTTTASWADGVPPSPVRTQAPRAAAAIAIAGMVGCTTQALFWRTGMGLNFFLWTLLSIGGCLLSARTRRPSAVACGVIASAIVIAFSFVRFAGEWAETIAVPTTLGLLFVLPLALRDQPTLAEAASLPLRALRAYEMLPVAVREASHAPVAALGGKATPLIRVAKGLAIGFPVTCVFVCLLSSDVDFGELLVWIEGSISEGLSFALWCLLTTAGALVVHFVHQHRAKRADRDEHDAFRDRSLRDDASEEADGARAGRVAVSSWVMVIGQVAGVFALFVAVNLRNLFGGKAVVRAAGSMTYAKYLHAGVGQLLLATALSICLVAVGHRLLRPGGTPAGDVPGGLGLKTLECSLLGLTALTVVSCAERLAIYQDAYGATRQRLGVAFVVVAVIGALIVTFVKVLRRSWNAYGGTLASLFVGIAVVASLVNADAYVARANLDRAAQGKSLDTRYLAELSVDARDALSHPVLQADPAARALLARVYCAPRASSDWRALRGPGACNP